MIKIQIMLFNGFDELDAIAPFEVLRTATEIGADIQVELVTMDEPTEIVADHGLRVQPDAKFRLDRQPDVLIVPGGGWFGNAIPGAKAEVKKNAIPQAILQLHHKGTTIASVCLGGMLLAATGLLANRHAITHHLAIEDLKASGAKVIKARVVDDGDIITAGGVTSGLDLALWLLERYLNSEVAHKVENILEYERRGTVWRKPAS